MAERVASCIHEGRVLARNVGSCIHEDRVLVERVGSCMHEGRGSAENVGSCIHEVLAELPERVLRVRGLMGLLFATLPGAVWLR